MYNEFMVSHEVLEQSEFIELSSATKVVYIFLCKLTNRYGTKEGKFWRSYEQLSEDTNLSVRAVKYAVKLLKETGFIEVKKGCYGAGELGGRRAPNWYKVINQSAMVAL